MSDLPPAERWRGYIDARWTLMNAAARRVPLASVAQQARALALWDGKRAVPGEEMQLACLLDLGMLDPVGDHGRGIDRQAKAEPPAPDTPEARMLAALQSARFGLYRLQGPHPAGGVAAEAVPDGTPLQIFDNHLGRAPPGTLVGLRLAWPEPDIAMNCGTVVAVDSQALERLLLGTPPQRGPVVPRQPALHDDMAVDRLLADPAARDRLASLAAAPGFAAQVYRTALDLGLLGPVPGRTPPR